MWVERGGDDDVFTWRQFEALAHLSQVEEGVAPCNGLLTQQHIRAEMNVIATHDLRNKTQMDEMASEKLVKVFHLTVLCDPQSDMIEKMGGKITF